MAVPIFAAIHNFTEALAASAIIEEAERKVMAWMEAVAVKASLMIRCAPQSLLDVHVPQQMNSDFNYWFRLALTYLDPIQL